MELSATGVRRQQNSLVYVCPSNPTQHVVFFQGDAQNFRDQMAVIEETAPWKQWCLEYTCTLLQRKFPTSAIWIVRPSRMLRNLFSCYPNFVQSSLIGIPTYNSTYGCLPQLEGLLKDAVQRVIRNGELDMDVRHALKLPIVLIGFSKGCVVLNQIIHELVNYLIPDSFRPELMVHGHSLYRSRKFNYSQSTPSIPSGEGSTIPRPRRSGDSIGHIGHQRSQPSSPSMPRCERLSSTEVFPDSTKHFSRSKPLASPETTHRTKKVSSSENSRSSLGERLSCSGLPHGMDQLTSSDQTPYDDRLSNSSQERLGSPEIQQRNNHLTQSGSSLHGRSPVIQLSSETLASNEKHERLVRAESRDRLSSDTSRSRLSSTSSTKSDRGYTSEYDTPFPVFRSSSFGAPASKHIITPSENAIRSLTEFLRHIKAFYWLDAGHSGGYGAWITDSELLSMLASLGSEIHVHVTPQQIGDPHRLWIGEEERDFVEKLKTFGATVYEKVHFENEERSIELHFRVLDEF